MRRKVGLSLMIAGAVLILAALSLVAYNRWEADRARKASEEVLDRMEEILEAQEEEDSRGSGFSDETAADMGTASDTETDAAAEELSDREMTVVNIDGYDYIGYLSIPSVGLALPVMSQWSYAGLHVAPGRYGGTTFAGDLVICGHNYARHFSPIRWLEAGSEVIFTDMDGTVWTYQTTITEIIQPTAVEQMLGKTPGQDWDLTMFTCNNSGQARCTVRCVLVSVTAAEESAAAAGSAEAHAGE